jgi:DoxX-like protein
MSILHSSQLDLALWVAQGLLVCLFLFAGIAKATQPIARLAKAGPWVTTYPAVVVRLIGVGEILGALGLLLAGLFHFVTVLTPLVPGGLALFITTLLTPLVAEGLALTIAGAIATHLPRKEYPNVVFTVLALVLLLSILIGRLAPHLA